MKQRRVQTWHEGQIRRLDMTLILLKASKVKRQMLNSESVSYYREQKAINPNFRGDDKLDDLEDKQEELRENMKSIVDGWTA